MDDNERHHVLSSYPVLPTRRSAKSTVRHFNLVGLHEGGYGGVLFSYL